MLPPNIRRSGLGPALSYLTARLRTEGLDVNLDAPPGGFDPDVDELLDRACQGGAPERRRTLGGQLRRRARAAHGSNVVLVVTDDGIGIHLDWARRTASTWACGSSTSSWTTRAASSRSADAKAAAPCLRVEVPVRR